MAAPHLRQGKIAQRGKLQLQRPRIGIRIRDLNVITWSAENAGRGRNLLRSLGQRISRAGLPDADPQPEGYSRLSVRRKDNFRLGGRITGFGPGPTVTLPQPESRRDLRERPGQPEI